MRAALAGSQQIGFTVISISISLMAAFIPLLLLGGDRQASCSASSR